MASHHGTRGRYLAGCRCDGCRAADAVYRRGWRERRAADMTRPPPVPVAVSAPEVTGPGRVESAVAVEISTLPAAGERPGLVEAALALGRVLDDPRVASVAPQAAGKLMVALEVLRSSGQRPRGKLAVVRSMTARDGA